MIILERYMDHGRETKTNAPMGCLGELYMDGEFYCNTIEQPWRDNRPFVSCVPVGEYQLVPFNSTKYGPTLALVNHDLHVYATQDEAPRGARYACLIHAANWSHQLQGCIAFGQDIAWGKNAQFKYNIMVTNSRNTVQKLLPAMAGESLLIRWKH